jgi:hypothetical protein
MLEAHVHDIRVSVDGEGKHGRELGKAPLVQQYLNQVELVKWHREIRPGPRDLAYSNRFMSDRVDHWPPPDYE